jgi:hypothetical protein
VLVDADEDGVLATVLDGVLASVAGVTAADIEPSVFSFMSLA